MGSSLPSPLVTLVAFIACTAAAPVRAAAQQGVVCAPDTTRTLVAVRIPRAGVDTVALARGTPPELLVPVAPVLALAGVDPRSARAAGCAASGTRYATVPTLARILGVPLSLDTRDLAVIVDDRTGSLPATRRAILATTLPATPEDARAPGALRTAPDPAPSPSIAGAVIQYDATLAPQCPAHVCGAAASLGVTAAGGDLTWTARPAVTALRHGVRWRAAWDDATASHLWARTIALGDLYGNGAPAIALSSTRGTEPVRYRLNARTAARSIIELHVNGVLTSIERAPADGRYTRTIELPPGHARIMLVERRRGAPPRTSEHLLILRQGQLARGEATYDATAHACGPPSCSRIAALAARAAPHDRLMLALATIALRDRGESHTRGYIAAEALLLPADRVAVAIRARGSGAAEIATDAIVSRQTTVSVAWAARAGSHQPPVAWPIAAATPPLHDRLAATLAWRAARTPAWIAITAALPGAHSAMTSGIIAGPLIIRESFDLTNRRRSATLEVTTLALPSPLASLLRLSRPIAQIGATTGPVPHLTLALSGTVIGRAAVTFGATLGGARSLILAVRPALSWLRASATSVTRPGATTAASTISGAISLDGTRVRADTLAALGVGSVAGTVFHDLDGDGSHDTGEPPLPAIPVRVGTALVVTSTHGNYSAYSLAPFATVTIEPDTGSLAAAMLVPREPRTRVRILPNAIARADLAVVTAGSITGEIAASGAVPVALVSASGATVARAVTFGDGTFEFRTLRPGRYRITLDSTTATKLGVASQSGELVVRPGAVTRAALPARRVPAGPL